MYRITPPSDYNSIMSGIHKTNLNNLNDLNNLESCTSGCFLSTPITVDIENLKNLSNIAQQAVFESLNKKTKRRPHQVRTVFHEVIDEMKKNGASYLQTAKIYEDKYKDLVLKWNTHKDKYKKIGDIAKWWPGEGDTRSKIQNEFDLLLPGVTHSSYFQAA